jgi:hypothetical protein
VLGDFPGMPLQSDQVLKRGDAVQFRAVDERHVDVADARTVEGFVKQRVASVQDYLAVILPISGKRLRSIIAGILTTGVV